MNDSSAAADHEPEADKADPVPKSHATLEGRELEATSDATRHELLVKARDYRGDVTVETVDGRREEGFLFDYGPDTDPPRVRLMRADGERVRFDPAEVKRVVFSGRDTAFGKSWDAWMRKYEKLKQAGETAELYPEPLSDDSSADPESDAP